MQTRSFVLLAAIVVAAWPALVGTSPRNPAMRSAGPDANEEAEVRETPVPLPFAETRDVADSTRLAQDTPPQTSAAPPTRPNQGRTGNRRVVAWVETLFERLDQNGDGLLNTDEMPPALRSQLVQWDRNQDGLIDPQEFAAFTDAVLRQRPAEAPREQGSSSAGQGGWLVRAGDSPSVTSPRWAEEADFAWDDSILEASRPSGRTQDGSPRAIRNPDGRRRPSERWTSLQAGRPNRRSTQAAPRGTDPRAGAWLAAPSRSRAVAKVPTA
jgi:hypothetical protein